MTEYETSNGYFVEETMDGLDISLNGEFKCELSGRSLADYSYENDEEEFEVDDKKLEEDIEFELGY